MNVLQLFQPITTFVFDVDGVLTDGSLLLMPNGLFLRKMNMKDGYALQLAKKKGYNIAIISGSSSEEVVVRLNRLGIFDIWMNVENKLKCLQQYMQQKNIASKELLYMGDDIPDYECMQNAGLAACPANAVTEIKSIAHYISPINGGEGCVRDVIEKTLKLKNEWQVDFSVKAE
jgi:3-deoxy-D-manno-octulosonate 8-phosphate phosphatase (KDO 8-P phosphatase)